MRRLLPRSALLPPTASIKVTLREDPGGKKRKKTVYESCWAQRSPGTTLETVSHWTSRHHVRCVGRPRRSRGHGRVGTASVILPGKKVHASAYALRRHKGLCRRRPAIEAGHRSFEKQPPMGEKYFKGFVGGGSSALLAGANLNLLLSVIVGYFSSCCWALSLLEPFR